MICAEPAVEIPAKVLSSPALLYLYHRVEQILGIKTETENLIKLNDYLEKRSGASFIENPAAYENMLSSRERIFEISSLLTVNETYFFREGVHFDLLASFLPQLAKLNRPIQICSAAASTGCEAYSIAMLLDYHSKKGPGFDFVIDAFDVSAEAVKTAKNGRYTANTLRQGTAAWNYISDSYLIPDGGEYVVSKDIRGKVRFFPHNIMCGLDRQYDVIFFRNALIYFSPKNRLVIMNDLAESLFSGGVLFIGIAETSSVKHPLLESCCLSDVFYFKKTGRAFYYDLPDLKQNTVATVKKEYSANAKKPIRTETAKPPEILKTNLKASLPVNCEKVAAILGRDEGEPNAKKTLEFLESGNDVSACEASPLESELVASAVYFLGVQDFNSADMVLVFLEKLNAGAFTRFLRGEYHFLRGSAEAAEPYFKEAAGKEKAFWPAFYRIASLAAHGNPASYGYKIKKACESLDLGREFHYECFLGGFSPDYYRQILIRRAPEIQLNPNENKVN